MKVLKIYGTNGKLLDAVKSFSRDSKACMKVNGKLTEWFVIEMGARQRCLRYGSVIRKV